MSTHLTPDQLRQHLDAETEDMLMREFRQASFANREADQNRWRVRAVDKVLEEFRLLGFAGFRASVVDGRIQIEGIAASGLVDVPEHLRANGAA